MQLRHRILRGLAAATFAAAGAFPVQASDSADPLAAVQEAFARAVAPGEQADFYRGLFPGVFERVQRSQAKGIDAQVLADAVIKALAPLPPGAGEPREVFGQAVNAALRGFDGYARYVDPRAWTQQRSEVTGSFGGVGLQLEPGEGALRVASAVPDGPAARAGVQAGDLIVRVDDKPLAGVALTDAVARLRGEPGTPVSLVIRREGQEFTLAFQRDTIRMQALRWSMEGDVLVLRLSTFSAPVSAALEEAVAKATATHTPRAVVLDLRGNGGGLLREAVRTADAFLTQGEIVSVRGRNTPRVWQADAQELLPGAPMVVLVDRRSASASELLAAALQDHGRATVMGQRSFGKGTVQVTYPLGEGQGAIKLTTATYHAPSGRSVQDVGVIPDVELAIAQRRDEPPAGTPAPRLRIPQERCAGLVPGPDPALACALAWLRAGGDARFAEAAAEATP